MVKSRFVFPATLVLFIGFGAHAGEEYYLGSKFGFSHLSNKKGMSEFLGSNETYGVSFFGGKRIAPNVDFEIGYSQFGKKSYIDSNSLENNGISFQTFDLTSSYFFGVTESLELYIKAGGAFYSMNLDDFDSTDITYTFGVGTKLNIDEHWSAILDLQTYKGFEVRKIGFDNTFFSLGLRYNFFPTEHNYEVKKYEEIVDMTVEDTVMEKNYSGVYTVHFDIDSKDSSNPFELDKILNTVDDLDESYYIEIKGYADSPGSYSHNLKLSEERAKFILEKIKARIKTKVIEVETKWYGEINGENISDYKNRKVDVVVYRN